MHHISKSDEFEKTAPDKDRLDELLTALFQAVTSDCSALTKNDFTAERNRQFDGITSKLWNYGVTGISAGKLTATSNAKLRHIACVIMPQLASQKSQEALLKLTKMSLKGTTAWLDVDNPSMADVLIGISSQTLEKLKIISLKLQDECNSATDVEQLKTRIDQDFFNILCCKAQAASAHGDNQTGLQMVARAKEVRHTSNQSQFLCMLCYNLGVDSYKKQKYQDAILWLKESFELGKEKNSAVAANQARTLRLLANAYIECDSSKYSEKALNAICLANSEHCVPAGLYTKVHITLLANSQEEQIKTSVDDLLNHEDIRLNLELNIADLLFKFDRRFLGNEVFARLGLKYKNTLDFGKVLVARIETLLKQNHKGCRGLVEEAVLDHKSSSMFSPDVISQLNVIIWDKAAEVFESKQYSEALEWYNLAWSLAVSSDDLNGAKMHRNRASCFIAIEDFDKAEEAIKEAMKHQKNSPFTYFVKFKLALARKEVTTACDMIKKMGECSVNQGQNSNFENGKTTMEPHGLISLTAQMAFEAGHRTLVITSLEGLADVSEDPQQLLTTFRCLCRLRLANVAESNSEKSFEQLLPDIKSMCGYISKAFDCLKSVVDKQSPFTGDTEKEINWFMKIAWNLALQSEESCSTMYDLFMLSYKLTKLCSSESQNLTRKKACLLMIIAANLQLARNDTDFVEKKRRFHETLGFIDECKVTLEQLQEELSLTSESTGKTFDQKSKTLLILYEFETRCNLGDVAVEKIVDEALSLSHTEAKTFETIAALAMEPPACHRKISMRALKIAIKKHLQAESPSFEDCARAFHSIIEMSLSARQNESMDEAKGYFADAIDLIENRAKSSYPELETLWLMTKAWNCGVHLYSGSKYEEALRWCELSMRLLKYIGTLRTNYEPRMSSVYGEILNKSDVTKDKPPLSPINPTV